MGGDCLIFTLELLHITGPRVPAVDQARNYEQHNVTTSYADRTVRTYTEIMADTSLTDEEREAEVARTLDTFSHMGGGAAGTAAAGGAAASMMTNLAVGFSVLVVSAVLFNARKELVGCVRAACKLYSAGPSVTTGAEMTSVGKAADTEAGGGVAAWGELNEAARQAQAEEAPNRA